MAQSSESKFFRSGKVSPSRSEPNLQPKRCIPNILQTEIQEQNMQRKNATSHSICFFFLFLFKIIIHTFFLLFIFPHLHILNNININQGLYRAIRILLLFAKLAPLHRAVGVYLVTYFHFEAHSTFFLGFF